MLQTDIVKMRILGVRECGALRTNTPTTRPPLTVSGVQQQHVVSLKHVETKADEVSGGRNTSPLLVCLFDHSKAVVHTMRCHVRAKTWDGQSQLSRTTISLDRLLITGPVECA